MSSGTIDRALITQFSSMVHVSAQQMNARLRPFVSVKPMTGDIYAYDGLGLVQDREVTGRVVPTVFDDIEHLRRKISRRRFVTTLAIDASDVRGKLTDPQSDYAAAVTKTMARRFDRIGVEAAFADVLTGRNFETTVTFATDGGATVTATAGLTYEKLLEMTKSYENNEVGLDNAEPMLFLITGTEGEALMQEVELTSGDFSRQYAVDKGSQTMAAGHKLIKFGASVASPVLSVSAGVRSCVSFVGRGLCYAMSKEMSITIKDRPDYVETKQVQIISELGAVRTEGVLIQKVTTTS